MTTDPIHVLMIEDDPDDVLLMRESLTEAGALRIKLAHADRLSEGLKRIAEQKFDVVLLDLNLPDSRGLGTLRDLLQQVSTIPVVVLSGLADDLTTIEAVRQGAQDYLVKGEISGSILARVLRYAIERKRAEAAIQEQAERFRTMMSTISEGFWLVDDKGRLLDVNEAYCRMSAYSKEELLTLSIPDLEAAETQAETAGHIQTIIESGSDLFESRHKTKDGRIFDVEISVAFWPAKRQFFVFIQDITDRKLAEEQTLKQLTIISNLYATTQKLTHKMDLDFLVKDVTRTCVEAFEAQLAWIGVAEDDGRITVRAMHGRGADSLDYSLRWDGQGEYGHLAAQAFKTGFPLIVQDVLNDPRAAFLRPLAAQHQLASAAIFPLISRQQPFGVLSLWSDHKNFFDEDRVGFLTSYSHQVAAALENARLFAETEERLKNVQALRAIDSAITSSLDLKLTLGVVLGQTMSQLKVDAASILLLPPGFQTLEYAAGRGFRTKIIERTRLHLGEGRAGRVALDRQTLVESDLSATITDSKTTRLDAEEKFVMYACAPLITKGKVRGVLEVFNRSPLHLNGEWIEFLETLAEQTAIAIESHTLLTDLQKSNAELNMAYDITLEGWSRAMDLRDKETEGHTQRVTDMTMKLAYQVGMSDIQIVNTRRGALLHDMGKLGIPDSILLKPGKLTDDEWVIMKKHPQYAYDMLYPIPYLRPALDIPLCHHEKWDGTGYPRGLKGEEIPLAARLFAIADVWDALSNDRPYRKGWTEGKVQAFIREQSGKHFDPKVVEVFLKMGM